MNLFDMLRWGFAILFWCLAISVIVFNVQRQFHNAKCDRNGTAGRKSGVAFLATIFTFVGGVVSPLTLAWLAIISLPFELFGLADFRAKQVSSNDEG